jgi:hypothetical protein
MNKKLFSVSKILSSFERFWFSDELMGKFIAFPAGMWIMIVLIACVSFFTSPFGRVVSMLLFTIGAFATIFLGYTRRPKKGEDDEKEDRS